MLAETYLDLLTSLPHWLFEATTAAVGIPFGIAYQRWHDRKHHGVVIPPGETLLTPSHESDTLTSWTDYKTS